MTQKLLFRDTLILLYIQQVYVCMCVCYATPRRSASQTPNFQTELIYDTTSTIVSSRFNVFIHPDITPSTNNRMTICSYYVQLSATLCEQLCTIVDNIMRLFLQLSQAKGKALLDITITASSMLYFRDILTGSTKAYMDISVITFFNIVIVTVTYDVPSYPVRMTGILLVGIIMQYFNTTPDLQNVNFTFLASHCI